MPQKVFFQIIMLLLIWSNINAQDSCRLVFHPADKDAAFLQNHFSLRQTFSSEADCRAYIDQLPDYFHQQGYINFSLDSLHIDSTRADAYIYIGLAYKWANIRNGNIPPEIFSQSGFSTANLRHTPLSPKPLKRLFEKIIAYYENHGYPYAEVKLDSFQLEKNEVTAAVFVNKGYLFHIDSLNIAGNAHVQQAYLQNYLGIHHGDIYNERQLRDISRKIDNLQFLQESKPWDLYFSGSEAQLNLYLQNKKSSQFDFIVGFLPNSQQTGKFLLTGEASLNLQNAFGHGEGIKVNWQQLQPQSPQLNMAFQYPYLFNTPFGINLQLDLYKKDSLYLNLNEEAGLLYAFSNNNYAKIFLRNNRSTLLSVDTATVKYTHQLPQDVDFRRTTLGFAYAVDATDYQISPTRGYTFNFSLGADLKHIIKNNNIINLTADKSDSTFNYASLYDSLKLKSYQSNIQLAFAKYFHLGKRSVLKTAVNSAALLGNDIFRNELYRVGGFQLLRGFDEESIYASFYTILTLEYRYLLSQDSYLFLFSDNAYVQNHSQFASTNDFPTGLGAGMAFSTKAGIFSISYAVGRRFGNSFNLRQSKIHLGYVNSF